MRRLLLSIIAFLSLALFSCSKSFDAATEEEINKDVFNLTLIADSPEYDNSDESKADMMLVGREIWAQGDQISVIDVTNGKYLGNLSATAIDEAGKATFSGQVELTAGQNYALAYVYPTIKGKEAGDTFTSYAESLTSQNYSTSVQRIPFCSYATGNIVAPQAGTDIEISSLNFTLATSFLNLNIADAPCKAKDITQVYVGDINNGVKWSIQGGQFVVLDPETTNGGIVVNLTATSETSNVSVRIAIPKSAQIENSGKRKLNIVSKISSLKTIYTGQFSGSAFLANKYYNAILVARDFQPIGFSVTQYRTVQFSPGNLYCDASQATPVYHFESTQYDYSKTYGSSHVSHFYWSKTASVAYAENYSDTPASTDYFFADKDHSLTVDEVDKWYVLDRSEWDFLKNRKSNDKYLVKAEVSVCSHPNCVIIAPDGYTGTLKSSYDATEWAKAEAEGLVCLAAAGRRVGNVIDFTDNLSRYWTSTPSSYDVAAAFYVSQSSLTWDIIAPTARNVASPLRMVRILGEPVNGGTETYGVGNTTPWYQ